MTAAAVKPEPAEARRLTSTLGTLDVGIGAHPDALRAIFGAGRPADPAELGDAPRGRILAVAEGVDLFLLTRPLVRALSSSASPWQGKTFDHGGNSGQNLLFGRTTLRFRAQLGPSALDGRPALRLTYDEPAHANPWPFRAMVDELRTVGPGVAIGPMYLAGAASRILLWFGLEAPRAS